MAAPVQAESRPSPVQHAPAQPPRPHATIADPAFMTQKTFRSLNLHPATQQARGVRCVCLRAVT
jgi:hypothetical protein